MRITVLSMRIVMVFALASLAAAMSAQPVFTFSTSKRGPMMGDLHYGIFYEEINHGGDGGLYAELIRNRSFEDNAANPDCWWGLGGMSAQLVHTGLLNQAQGNALKLTVNEYNAGIRNEGFWGMNIVKGEEYTLTFWAKTDGTYNGKMWAELQNDGFENMGRTEFAVSLNSEWKKYTVKITATASVNKGWLALKGLEPMVIYLDVVSLMPPTFKNRTNGCRKDLAEMLANLHPSFVRFPGGCYIEGTWQDEKTNRFEWKKTIGPIEQRPGHMNVNWGYRVSDGLGFHELLQLTEDLGAEPLFVCNVGLGHGWMQPYSDINDYIQEALDAIEYCNGDINTTWGRKRADNGHPEPFNLRLLEIGNENYNFISWDNGDMSDHYAERYAAFYKAIKAIYPDIILIGNVEAWATDNPSWRNANPVEVVDEHYYRSTSWFRQQYNKYDNYNRDNYKVYAGEYAVTSEFGNWGNLNAALAEAIYMAGMERNSDVCTMSSYAPIFCNENHPWPWMPDMIRFNSYSAFGTPSYYVQQLMAANVGYQNITWEEKGNYNNVRNTAFGLSSWGTAVTYDNLTITTPQGGIIYSTDFSNADDYTLNWNHTGGEWNINSGSLKQTDTNMFGQCNVCYNLTGEDCIIELDATKNSGAEGFLIAFSYNDPDNFVWWNLGGWNNTQHAIEQCVDGVKTTLVTAQGSLQTNTTYHLRIVKANEQVYCYVGDSLYHQVPLPDTRKIYTCAALNEAEDELIIKMVNPSSKAEETTIQFADFQINGNLALQVLKSGSGNDENVMTNQRNVYPTSSTMRKPSDSQAFVYTVPAYSLVVMRVPVTEVSPQKEVDDNDGWVDITDRIQNPDFSNGQMGWNGTKFSNTPGTVSEFFNTTFDTYQTLSNMPAGEYRLTIDGFYRYGDINTAYTSHVKGTEKLLPVVYITAYTNTATKEFMSLYDNDAPFSFTPEYTYPDNTATANLAFNMKGAYHTNTVQASLEKEGSLRIGMKKTVAMVNDWTCFDNVHLYYRAGQTAINDIDYDGAADVRLSGVYDLTGRMVTDNIENASLTPGIYIVNGKKVIIK
jgi:alpha-L-arabinofuranosidase